MKYLTTSRLSGVLGLIVLSLILYACTEDFSAVNTNPNQPSEAATPFLMTNAQKSLADNYWGEFELGYFGNLYAQYWSQNQYTDESQYAYRESVVNDIWGDYYTTLNDLQRIIELNRNQPEATSPHGLPANQIAVAKILKAWTFHTITDIWGAVPFSEALGGRQNPSPAYDSQEAVYTGILQLLTEAVDSMDTSQPGFSSGDIIYGGDMQKWKKFANSLKMRVGIRMADINPQMAETAINEALDSGVFTSNEDNALFTYQSSVPNNNPINEAYKDRDDFAASEALISTMQQYNDPRISAYATRASDCDCYDGFVYGLEGGQAASVPRNSFSRPSERVRGATAPAILMLYDEVLFIQAEAAQRGFIPGGSSAAEDYYEQAIEASMNYWGVTTQSEIDNYISNVPYEPGNWRQVLGEQKWLALYMQGVQGWSEFRRLDFTGVLEPPASGKLVDFPGDFPARYPYPTDEANLNNQNRQAAVETQGWAEDDQGRMLWWDVN